jgi:hypothetical protein
MFKRLEHANFRANLHKCFFAQEELEYLGYWHFFGILQILGKGPPVLKIRRKIRTT